MMSINDAKIQDAIAYTHTRMNTPGRDALLEQLHAKLKSRYRDMTRYTTCKAIRNRLDKLKQQVATTPRHHHNFKKIQLEHRLLQWKWHVYNKDDASMPAAIHLKRMELQLSDRMSFDQGLTQEERDARKYAQARLLLDLSLATHDNHTLAQYVAAHGV